MEVVALPRADGEARVWELRRGDVTLGPARTEPQRGGTALTELGVPADEQVPVDLGVHRRRQQEAGVEQQRLASTVGGGQCGDRVGGAQVDAQLRLDMPRHADTVAPSINVGRWPPPSPPTCPT